MLGREGPIAHNGSRWTPRLSATHAVDFTGAARPLALRPTGAQEVGQLTAQDQRRSSMVGKPFDIAQVIQTSGRIPIGTVAVPQARMVIQGRRGWRAVVLVDDLLWLPVFEMVAPGKEETDAAYAAFIALGEGSGHPAGLNFGDVFSCALARARNLPLLYKDNDFARTDIVGVLRGSTGHP